VGDNVSTSEDAPELAIGHSIPPFVNRVTYMELNQFAGANREWGLHHMDPVHSQRVGLKDVMIMGNLKLAYLGNMLEDWVGDGCAIRRVSASYRGLDYVGDELRCGGQVASQYVVDGRSYVECELWIENQRGERNTNGSAVILLPERVVEQRRRPPSV
jgi:hypothetical protein